MRQKAVIRHLARAHGRGHGPYLYTASASSSADVSPLPSVASTSSSLPSLLSSSSSPSAHLHLHLRLAGNPTGSSSHASPRHTHEGGRHRLEPRISMLSCADICDIHHLSRPALKPQTHRFSSIFNTSSSLVRPVSSSHSLLHSGARIGDTPQSPGVVHDDKDEVRCFKSTPRSAAPVAQPRMPCACSAPFRPLGFTY
jgi:hypothetical protein